jgi:hypothetical protein
MGDFNTLAIQVLPWLNVLLIPIVKFLMNMNERLVRLEVINEVTRAPIVKPTTKE